MEHRRLMILFALISLFAFGVIVWYFLFSKPEPEPTIEGTANPLSVRDLPARFGFIFQSEAPEQTTETEVTPPEAQAFVRVWDKPTTGNVFVSRPILKEIMATTTVGTTTAFTARTVRATTTILMFVDRITGYVHGHDVETGKTYQITNTTVPGVYDAYIWSGGTKVLMRYLDTDRKTILSLLATIPNVQEGRDPEPLKDTTTPPQGITSVAVSQNLSKVSYLVPNDLGASVYTMSSSGVAKVADTPFSEWILSYGGESLYATTKPSAYVEGMTVSLPSFTRLVGEKTGLLSKPSSGGVMLSSMWARSGLILFGAQGDKTSISEVKTLATKCAPFASAAFVCGVPKTIPSGREGLPDDWFQGVLSFDDKLMTVDPLGGDWELLYEFGSTFGPMDVTSLAVAQAGELISFVRKQDGSLFLLNTRLLE